jgi:hypothetical protein
MDLYKAIRDLHEEKRRLDRVIETLEGVVKNGAKVAVPTRRRGRKNMSAEERKVVSERMRKYWAARRKQGPSDSRAEQPDTIA